ncbi:toll-like receptor 2 type-1 [Ischnura elegans]|uniref:toll-like receptor 2 type-1 n=1 Tax=Ischnura elegans TaxID=197161 RepID=UPI001ED89BA9|nr:toll-like receptor 2 type-1 [Ischnura elegans]
MTSLLLAVVLLVPSMSTGEFSFGKIYDLAGCSPAASRRQRENLEASVCTVVAGENGDDRVLNCVLHPKCNGPECERDRWSHKRLNKAGEIYPRKKKITLYLDIKFGLVLERPESVIGENRGRSRCTRKIALSYRDTLPEICGHNILPRRRAFQWYPGKGELPTSFEVIDSVPIGTAYIEGDCIERDEEKPNACRISAKIRWKENWHENGQLSYTGKLIDASMENRKTADYSHALEINALEFETPELLKISNIKSNFIAYDGQSKWNAIYSVISQFKDINVLNISGSPIKFFAMEILSDKHQLQELVASSCAMRAIEEDSFKHNMYLTHIDLSKNELNSLPQNIFKDLKFLTYLNLSHNKFSQGEGFNFNVPLKWPDCGLQLLDMSSNSLGRAANLIGYGNKVRHINLSDNLLKDLSNMMVGRSIKELNLSGNRIETLSLSSLESLNLLDYVDLTKNMLDCASCSLVNLQSWLNTTGRNILTSPPEELRCWSPIQLRYQEKNVLEVQYTGKPCLDKFKSKLSKGIFRIETLNTFIFLLLTTTILALVTSTFFVYHYEILQYIRKFIKNLVHQQKQEYIYDASVSYSASNESWVRHVLKPKLENSKKKYRLFCIDRELELGKIMKKYIKECMQRCRKSIIIISNEFVDCEGKNQARYQKMTSSIPKEKLIIIFRSEQEKPEFPGNLQSSINEITYLEWPKSSSTEKINATMENEWEDSLSEKKFGSEDSYEMDLFWKSLFEALGDSLFNESSYSRENDESKDDPQESDLSMEEKDKSA